MMPPRRRSSTVALLLLLTGPAAPGADDSRRDAYGDPLPEGALFRLGSVRYRHPGGVNNADLSPDGRLLATTGNGTVALLEVATGRRVHWLRDCDTPPGFRYGGGRVVFSPDGRWFAQVSKGNVAAILWDSKTGRRVRTLGTLPKRGARPEAAHETSTALRFSPDGREILVYGYEGMAFYDATTGMERRRVQIPGEPEAFSPDGKHFAALARPWDDRVPRRTLLICSTQTGREESRFDIPVVTMASNIPVAFSRDGKNLATTDGQAVIRIWEPATGKERQKFELATGRRGGNPARRYTILYYAPDGRTLFAGTSADGVRRYDLAAGRQLPPLTGHNGWVTGLHVTPDGRTLVSTSWDATIRRWDLGLGTEIALPEGYLHHTGTAISPDGAMIACGDSTGRLDLWASATGKMLRRLRRAGPGVGRVAFSPDGRTLAVGDADGIVRLYDPAEGAETRALAASEADATGRTGTCALAFSPDGSRLLAASPGDRLRMWDVQRGKTLWSLPIKDDSTAAFSPDGRTLATGGWKSNLLFRDPATGQERGHIALPAAARFMDCMAFSPDGRILATTHRDFSLRFWDPNAREEIRKLTGHDGIVLTIRFTPDGKWAVSGGCDNTVRVWEVVTGKEVLELVGHDAWVWDAAFGSDARTILSTSGPEVLLWSARPRTPAAEDIASLWGDLLGEDAAKAYAAVWALADRAPEACAFLAERVAAVKTEDVARLAKLIADLDSDAFAAREAATKAVQRMGAAAEPALRRALEKPASLEAERRMRRLLEELRQGPSREEIRLSRAVQALELAGTGEARQLLGRWAAGAAGARLTEDAKGALARLGRK